MSTNAKMGFQVDDDGATRATASFDCLWLHQPPARSPRIRPLSSFSNITMPAADWTFIGPLDFLTPTEWSRGSSRMADMVRARWWDGTAASMSREVGKNDRMCFFHFFLKGMLSQAILQMVGAKRAQVALHELFCGHLKIWTTHYTKHGYILRRHSGLREGAALHPVTSRP